MVAQGEFPTFVVVVEHVTASGSVGGVHEGKIPVLATVQDFLEIRTA